MTDKALDFDDMIALLIEADDAYFNSDKELMTDAEYDALKLTAQTLNKKHSYFMTVGSDVRGGKLKLPYPMPGLIQIHKYDGCMEAAGFGKNVTLTDKLDGVSCMILFGDKRNTGDAEFAIAYSRGNSSEGADITRSVKLLKFPKTIPNCRSLVVRAELIMKNDVFTAKYAGKYSTARALVAGQINKSDPDPAIMADIDFVAYSVVAIDHNTIPSNLTKSEALAFLQASGFEYAPFITTTPDKLNDAMLGQAIKDARSNSPYELDGIVISDESSHVSYKYKIVDLDSVVRVKCKRVNYEISKSGFYKPVVEIYPVKLYGTVVTFATGFNGKFIVDNCIGPGAEMMITKSGSVIPYIMSVVKPADKPEVPDSFNWNDNKVEMVVVDLDTNPQVKFKRVLSFFETLDVALLKEASLRSVFTALKYDDTSITYDFIISEMIELTSHEWVAIIGANGQKIYESMFRRLHNLKLETIMGALDYCGFGFGVRKARTLIEQVGEDAALDLTESQIATLDKFDITTASRIAPGLVLIKDFLDRNKDQYTLIKEVKTDELKGLSVVFTGFRDSELEERIQKMGGKISSSVSKKTSYLISAEGDSKSGKCKKATECGVPIISVEDFLEKFKL